MALIKCPECNKEISDKAKVCPNCGVEIKKEKIQICDECGTENSNSKICTKCGAPLRKVKKLNTRTKTIIGILLVIITIIVMLLGFNLHKKKVENDYKALLIKTVSKINKQGIMADYFCYEIADIWHDSIWSKYDVDFNDEIDDYLSDNSTSINKLTTTKNEIAEYMKDLKNVPSNKEYEEAYKEVLELYSLYSSLVDMATDPSGNYNQYTSKKEDTWKDFQETYNRIKILVPEISKDEVENSDDNGSI